MNAPVRRPLAILLLLSSGACANLGYEGAIGYRARKAAIERRPEAFGPLMEEAADTEPKSRLDNPKKTVLTHYLSLADDPGFLATIDAWNQKGWVDEDMVCPVYRAHFAAHHTLDPEAAARSASVCLDRARAAATADRQWELELCLLEAPFLVATATASLGPYLELATDPDEPEALRRGLLRGLTFREAFGPRARWGVTSTVTPEARREVALEEAEGWRDRLAWTLDALSERVPPTELAIASARGVMEVEQVLASFGGSFVAGYADSEAPDKRTWAWTWVRASKAAEPVDHLGGLGLWDRGREPAKDAYWYVCAGAPPAPTGSSLGPRVLVEAITVRASERLEPTDPRLLEACEGRPRRVGPYPLEQIARSVAAERLFEDRAPNARLVVRVKRRVVLNRVEPSRGE